MRYTNRFVYGWRLVNRRALLKAHNWRHWSLTRFRGENGPNGAWLLWLGPFHCWREHEVVD